MKLLFNGLVELNIDPAELRWAHFFHADIYTHIHSSCKGVGRYTSEGWITIIKVRNLKIVFKWSDFFETNDILL